MPVYEYLCPNCEFKFELLRPFSQADRETPCPRCQTRARRAVSVCAVFSRSGSGETSRVAGTGTSCAGCHSSSCSSCGH